MAHDIIFSHDTEIIYIHRERERENLQPTLHTKYMDTVSLADPSACIVEHSILRVKVFDALASNNVAIVLRRTGWITTESCISCKGDRIRAPSLHGGTNTSTLKLRCKMCGGTTRPDGGHPVLGLDVRGDSWS